MKGTPVVWVVIAALAGGVSVLLQAQSARAEGHPGHLGLLATLIRRPRYVAGLACMFVGFVSAAVALGRLPLFAVQAGRSSSLAVTAVLAVLVLGARLTPRDVVAVVAVGLGLVGLAFSSQPGRGVVELAGGWRWLPLVAVVILLAIGQRLSRGAGSVTGPLVGVFAGLAFTVVGLGVRGVQDERVFVVADAVRDPLLWTIPVAGLAGIHLGTIALTKASVVSVTSALIATETIAAAVVGFSMVGDRARPGLLWLALVGVGLVLAGALDLARFGGDLENSPPP